MLTMPAGNRNKEAAKALHVTNTADWTQNGHSVAGPDMGHASKGAAEVLVLSRNETAGSEPGLLRAQNRFPPSEGTGAGVPSRRGVVVPGPVGAFYR